MIGCCNLIVAQCEHVTILATAASPVGAGLVYLNSPLLSEYQGFSVGGSRFTLLPVPPVQTGPAEWEYTVEPAQIALSAGQAVSLYHDCTVGDSLPQICTFYKAGVDLSAEAFTFRGDLASSSQEVRGYWQGKGLPNGRYPAYLRVDYSQPWILNGGNWVKGSLRIIPAEMSRLKFAPFGNKIKGLWTNEPLIDPTVASKAYFDDLQLPGGL